MSDRVIFVGGAFVPEAQASISVLDHGLLYGDGVFETVFAKAGLIFRLDAHIERCFRSMAAIGLAPHFDRAELTRLVVETVCRNGLTDAYVKWLVTRGVNGRPLMDPTGCAPNLIILAQPYIQRVDAARAADGLKLKTTAVRRPPGQVLDARIKSLNYLNLVQAKLEAKAAGADEALLLDLSGRICEATGCNVFLVRDGRLMTPFRDILLGITREAVIELAPSLGLTVEERDLELYDAYTADEAFICSTAGGLLPVVGIDGRTIGSGRPGPLFERIAAAYAALIASPREGTAIDIS